MEKNNITIDDLAAMIKKGFDETARKDEMDARFNLLDKKFDKIEKLLTSLAYTAVLLDRV